MRWTIVLVLGALLAGGCSQPPANVYRVNLVSHAAINIDGKLDEPAWGRATPLRDFADPWLGGGSPTQFQAFMDQQDFYFAFTAGDAVPAYVEQWTGKATLNDEDRVELYFALDEKLDKYYCTEIDSRGRVHDFVGSYPRKWDGRWSMPDLVVAGLPSPQGYVVEGKIPLKSLRGLGLPELRGGQCWRVGLFRADLPAQADGPVHWITWINPHTPRPDFHTPAAFGLFQAGN
jgi:hypothetical protein